MSEIHIRPESSERKEASPDLVHSNSLALETATDLEQELAKFRSDWKNEVSRTREDGVERDQPQAKNIAVYREFPKRSTATVATTDASSEIVINEDSDCEYVQESGEDKARYLFEKGVQLEQQNRHYEGKYGGICFSSEKCL